ncbi:GIN domain-containing protein [Microbacterium sp. MYb66]|uniref:GIN domain-containing protein n=1 Tax=Microbacterium sp. MYb66 TaxID=1848692 RepID=UPI000CFF600A|nr:DUF2807 domain-containing protein [Microbacterium sp. MYb66]PRA83497.1 hypothetical protein CQ045_03750 [Microbacterium sp. MYb66]
MRSHLLTASAAALLVAVATALAGCASFDSSPLVAEQREITDVRVVELRTEGDLTVRIGTTPSLTVTAGERIIDRLTAEVSDGALRLDWAGDSMPRNAKISYELTVTALESVTVLGSGDARVDFTGASEPTIIVSGSGDVDATGIDAMSAEITMDGSGEVTVEDAKVDNLSVRIGGAGGAAIDGTAGTQRVELNGSGDYQATGLRSAEVFLEVHGSGGADISADARLEVILDGSGDVFYGGGARVTKDVSGSGELSRR